MDIRALVNQLNEEAQACLNVAIDISLEYNYQEVGLEHMLLAMKESKPHLFEQVYLYDVWLKEPILVNVMNAFTRHMSENDISPVLSPSLITWMEISERYSRENWHDNAISLEILLYTLISLPQLAPHLRPEGDILGSKKVLSALEESLQKKIKDSTSLTETAGGFAALEQFTHNLTRSAERDELDAVPERDNEIRQLIEVLLRRRQNNPLLTGEPGVGKTALIEGLALRIVAGKVPAQLLNNEVLTLDLGLLQSGASVKGVFEKRLQEVIKEVKAYPKPIILFIDEAHMLIGAGGTPGQADAANLLKPILARGELRTIAATTRSEYKKYFEKDSALARRFHQIMIAEPCMEAAAAMLRSVVPKMERHHKVRILNEAVVDTVNFAARYITGRQFPDKAIRLLDTACARVAISQNCEPPSVEEVRRLIARNELEQQALLKEDNHQQNLVSLREKMAKLKLSLIDKLKHYQQQKTLVEAIHSSNDESLKRTLQVELKLAHQAYPYVFDCVDSTCVADVVSGWTGIPLGRMLENEIDVLQKLEIRLQKRVFGQQHALALIACQIRIAKSQLSDPVKPVGVFMLTGPSGVGKTETALALATELYGGENKLITINMSEYQESHSVAGLKGSPPGYIGYGEGGILTEAVRRQPYSIVLLDEIEKAHPDVLEIFYQVFDKGEMEDAEGVKINFRNTLFLLTSNVASELIIDNSNNAKRDKNHFNELHDLITPQIQQHFTTAFVSRMQIVPYFPINDQMLEKIIEQKMNFVVQRFHTVGGCPLIYHNNVLDYIKKLCHGTEINAREVDHVITNNILPSLSDWLFLNQKSDKNTITIQVTDSNIVLE